MDNSIFKVYDDFSKYFIKKYVITNRTKGDKSIDDCVKALTYSFLKHNIDLEKFENDYNNDTIIINFEFFSTVGFHIWTDYINPYYLDFSKTLFSCRPTGLGTPNSAVGEGEFLFNVISTSITKPKKGDLQIKNLIKELKSENDRVYSDISGKEFNRRTLQLCEKYNLIPNVCVGNRQGVELAEIGEKQEHWKKELLKLNMEDRKIFLSNWLIETNTFTKETADDVSNKCFENNIIDVIKLRKEIVKSFNRKTLESRGEYKHKLFFKNENLFIIDNDPNNFDTMVDNDLIKIGSTFFRIFQNEKIGWYYSPSMV